MLCSVGVEHWSSSTYKVWRNMWRPWNFIFWNVALRPTPFIVVSSPSRQVAQSGTLPVSPWLQERVAAVASSFPVCRSVATVHSETPSNVQLGHGGDWRTGEWRRRRLRYQFRWLPWLGWAATLGCMRTHTHTWTQMALLSKTKQQTSTRHYC